MANNGIGASSFMDGFLRGWDFVDGIKTKQQDREDRVAERAENSRYRKLTYDLQKQAADRADKPTFSSPFEARDSAGNPVFAQVNDEGQVRGLGGFTPIITPKAATTTYKDGGYEVTRLTENGVPVGDPIGRSPIRSEVQEAFNNPVDEIDPSTGSPIRVQYSNRGGRRVVSGAVPIAKQGDGSPLPPKQILAQAGVARRNALNAVTNMLERNPNLGGSSEAQKALLEQAYGEELAALGLDQDMVNQAAGSAGRGVSGQGGSAAPPPQSSPVYAPAPAGLTGIPGAATYRTSPQFASGGAASRGAAQIKNTADYAALPRGAQYIDPSGQVRVKN